MVYTHTKNGLLPIKKDLLIWQNIDEPGGYYAGWSKPETEKNSAWTPIYVESKEV